MTDDRVATRITATDAGELAMQEWFVRERCEPPVLGVRFDGADDAPPPRPACSTRSPAPTPSSSAPSNPVISIGPILAVARCARRARRPRDRVVGVSPIIAGRPVKGPADRLMGRLGIERVVRRRRAEYREFCGALVHRHRRRAHVPTRSRRSACDAVVADTLMTDARVAAALARDTLAAVA